MRCAAAVGTHKAACKYGRTPAAAGHRQPIAIASAHQEAVTTSDEALQERRASGASASTSSRSAGGSYRAYGSRLTLREDRRQPGWLYLDEESYLPQGLAQVTPPHLRPPRPTTQPGLSPGPHSAPHHDHQQQQQPWSQDGHPEQQQWEQEGGEQRVLTAADVNRLFMKNLSYVTDPGGLLSLLRRHNSSSSSLQANSPPGQQPAPGSLSHPGSGTDSTDANTTNSSSSRRQPQPQPLLLSHLDGRSLVGALVWCVRYMDGRITPDTPTPTNTTTSSSSSGGRPAAPLAVTSPSPSGMRPLSRTQPPRTQQRQLQRAVASIVAAVGALVAQQPPPQGWAGSPEPAGDAWVNTSSPNSSSSTGAALAALLRPADLCSLVYCCAKLGVVGQGELLTAAAAALEGTLFACSPLELFRVSWGVARLRLAPPPTWSAAFLVVTAAKASSAEPHHLAVWAWSLARLGVTPPHTWLAGLWEASGPWLAAAAATEGGNGGRGFGLQSLANLAWALGRWRVTPPAGWTTDFLAAARPLLPAAHPVALSQLASGLALARVTPPSDWCEALEAAATARGGRDTAGTAAGGGGGEVEGGLAGWEPIQLCNLLRAFSMWEYRPAPEALLAWCAASTPLLPTSTPEDLAVMSWAFSQLRFLPSMEWWEGWVEAAAGGLHHMAPRQLSGLARAWGRWGVTPGPAFMRLYLRACSDRFNESTPGELSALALGLGQTRTKVSPHWLRKFLVSFCGVLPTAAPFHVFLVAACVPGLYRPSDKEGAQEGLPQQVGAHPQLGPLLQQVLVALGASLSQLEPGQLLKVVEVSARAGVPVPAAWLAAHQRVVQQMGQALTVEERGRLIAAYGRLQAA